ncbi:hypothetical protein V496_01627 [Pseudogymnoascus sp. VKM F-4515 (FW-2607)]|nr:hypothetical protein V496_01627 [Pseudogymnoascus sp. VKM F-4515 (FW-2607)]
MTRQTQGCRLRHISSEGCKLRCATWEHAAVSPLVHRAVIGLAISYAQETASELAELMPPYKGDILRHRTFD